MTHSPLSTTIYQLPHDTEHWNMIAEVMLNGAGDQATIKFVSVMEYPPPYRLLTIQCVTINRPNEHEISPFETA